MQQVPFTGKNVWGELSQRKIIENKTFKNTKYEWIFFDISKIVYDFFFF